MLKFNILKKKPNHRGVEALHDLFNLGELTCELFITPQQLYDICDLNRGNLRITELELVSIITNYIFINMGGSEKTTPAVVMSFMYLLLSTDNFKFPTIANDVKTSLSMDNTFKYLHDNKIHCPVELCEKMEGIIGEWLFNKLKERYTIIEEDGWDSSDVEEFLSTITSKTASYVKGEGAFKDIEGLFDF